MCRPRLKFHMEYCAAHPEELTKVAAVQKKVPRFQISNWVLPSVRCSVTCICGGDTVVWEAMACWLILRLWCKNAVRSIIMARNILTQCISQ